MNGNDIYKVADFDILPLKQYHSKDANEDKYIDLLKSHLSAATLFYSRALDLTNSFQRQAAGETGALWENADDRFFWNKFASQDLIDAAKTDKEVGRFITPLIYGYAKFVNTTVNGKTLTFGLITRRSRHRAGTRYFRRGIDAKGNVANFNETEQIVSIPSSKNGEHQIYTYLQTRGSVPVYWAEINNLKYRPTLQVAGDAISSATKHFDEQTKLYGFNYLVNLVNQKGYELPVKRGYENLVKELGNQDLNYIYFDFHHECSKMRWHRVQLLIDQLVEAGLDKQGWFQAEVGGEKGIETKLTQNSIVRTNCMDCLDRTNVVQSQLARWVLQKQLEDAGIVSGEQKWEQDTNFEFIFRNLWADNADAVSTAYSGTGALKTDFTRLGQRTKQGAFNDLQNSIKRYYLNNLVDGSRQDGFDLFLGNHAPNEALESLFYDLRPLKYQAMPYICLGSLAMVLTLLLFGRSDIPWILSKLAYIIWIGVFTYTCKFIFDNGMQYVNWPRLRELEFVKQTPLEKEGETVGWVYTRAIQPSSKKRD